MATTNQLVRKPRSSKVLKSTVPEQPAEAWRVHACVHHYAEEAELCNAEGRSGQIDQRF
jgi:hypothetical protein